MNIQGLLLIVLVFLPAMALGILVRFTPIYRLSQRTKRTRLLTVLEIGLICLVLTMEVLMGLSAMLTYEIAAFYFDSTFGLLSGVTREMVSQYHSAGILEIWMRQSIPWGSPGQICVSSDPLVCQLADQAMTVMPVRDFNSLLSIFILALLPTIINIFLTLHLTCRQPQSLPNAALPG